jgi:hypothetical protein
MLAMQRSVGNAAVQRSLGRFGLVAVQRDLAAYTREHADNQDPMGDGPAILEITSADAPGLRAALQALVTANKISSRDDGEKLIFANVSATRSEIVAALTAARYPKAVQMADALLERHRLSIYSRNEVQQITTIFGTSRNTIGEQNLEAQSRRGLTGAERTEATRVYGGSLNYDSIVLEDAPVMSIGGYARTTPWTINFPSGTVSSNTLDMPWLIHELGHSWQYARGVSMIRTLYHAVRGVYAYGGEAGLRAATAAGRGLSSFNTEQQADIAQDAYRAITSGGSLAVYQPFIDEFKAGRYR